MSKFFEVGDIVTWGGTKVGVVTDASGGHSCIEVYKLDYGPECRAWEGVNGIPVATIDVSNKELRLANETERSNYAKVTVALVAVYNDLFQTQREMQRLRNKQEFILGAIHEMGRDFADYNIKDRKATQS